MNRFDTFDLIPVYMFIRCYKQIKHIYNINSLKYIYKLSNRVIDILYLFI